MIHRENSRNLGLGFDAIITSEVRSFNAGRLQKNKIQGGKTIFSGSFLAKTWLALAGGPVGQSPNESADFSIFFIKTTHFRHLST